MDETSMSSPSHSGRLIALFVISIAAMVLALGMDELPFASAAGPLGTFAQALYFLMLAVLLYAVGRLGATAGAACDE